MFYSVFMALSDRERRLLAEMEAALATDDPRLQSRLAGSTISATKPRLLLGGALVALGIAVIFAGLIAKNTPVGVLGFLFALSGVLTLVRSIGALASGAGKSSQRQKGARTSFSDRMQQRWDRRNFE
ncbi:unannotated protein [freshwater metagenome]|uniref:Unannotated protein n=1 Tax=freshwater metagenome TaxID=449393 RepID=A0A6J6B5K7_9ZZZZ